MRSKRSKLIRKSASARKESPAKYEGKAKGDGKAKTRVRRPSLVETSIQEWEKQKEQERNKSATAANPFTRSLPPFS